MFPYSKHFEGSQASDGRFAGVPLDLIKIRLVRLQSRDGSIMRNRSLFLMPARKRIDLTRVCSACLPVVATRYLWRRCEQSAVSMIKQHGDSRNCFAPPDSSANSIPPIVSPHGQQNVEDWRL